MIGDLLLEFFQVSVIRILLYGVILVLATPFILVSAPFRKSGIRGGYTAVDGAFHYWF